MSVAKTLDQTNGRRQRSEHPLVKPARVGERRASASSFARIVALLLVSSAAIVGCAAESDDVDVASSEQALMASANESDVAASASASTRQVVKAPRASAASWTLAQNPGTVFGGGTVVVNFSQDPDGAWHCKGDADCNKMFSSGLCKGGILDSSCDTTGTVECWCY